MTDRSNQQVIDDYIRLKTGEGWQVVARSESSVQFKKPKQANRGLIVLGLLTLPLWGIGLIIWGWVLIDYLTQDEQVAFYTVDDIKSGVDLEGSEFEGSKPISMIKIMAITLIVMVIIFATVILLANLLG